VDGEQNGTPEKSGDARHVTAANDLKAEGVGLNEFWKDRCSGLDFSALLYG